MADKVLVIIPAYNEEECIVSTVNKLKNDCPEVSYIVINDCSKDETLNILRHNHINHVSLSVNLGIGGAVQCGYRYALKNDFDYAIQLDGDGQHDSAYIDELLKPLKDGSADIVIGSRFINKEGFQSSGIRRSGIRLLNGIIKLVSRKRVTDCTSGFRAINRKMIEVYADNYPVDYPEPEAIVYGVLKGANVMEVPVIMKDRQGGKSSIRPIHSIYYMLKVSIAIILCRLCNKRSKERI